ncbi:uncharacterized protein EI97DRAFT_207083 [Westerdykella ornata]|uniref:Uncharacterized protein n=1 Tax=Westerdykella ornata TaxID=318751 RepID=A0A6A6JBQ2_WESOR|nr:uncharacterized protein EI97DRAFT_207083 [Westerdykella ornata]KAF2272619.1 hypothetical protein EI97DRAFT_207083 [Westerdykella ornata]
MLNQASKSVTRNQGQSMTTPYPCSCVSKQLSRELEEAKKLMNTINGGHAARTVEGHTKFGNGGWRQTISEQTDHGRLGASKRERDTSPEGEGKRSNEKEGNSLLICQLLHRHLCKASALDPSEPSEPLTHIRSMCNHDANVCRNPRTAVVSAPLFRRTRPVLVY